ncbi:MAG TPA: dephospho-CoA kinase [Fimbriimonadaceae bacterium]|nr:dephospho-CoA kinase [Fimbriimonadaceae bacterium]
MAIALTGGIAEGKSTVLGFASDRGVRTASADSVVAELWTQTEFRTEVAEALGLAGPADKASVRARVTADPSARLSLNRLTHRRVMEALLGSEAELIEIPLLIETVAHPLFHRVWVVTCGASEQERRLRDRLGDAASVAGFLATQLPTRAKLAFADRILRTDTSFSHVLDSTVEALVEEGLLIRQS